MFCGDDDDGGGDDDDDGSSGSDASLIHMSLYN